MSQFRTKFEILTHPRHLLHRQKNCIYVLELAMLILASFTGCHILYSMQQEAGEEPGNEASYYYYTPV